MKHAFLIIAHNEPEVLAALLRQLDDERNDIYLHIDARSTAMREQFAAYRPLRAGFYLLPHPNAGCWGDISQVETELLLFDTAFGRGPYLYYHLLSGTDQVIKSQDYLYRFFERNAGKEFVHFWSGVGHEKDLRRKVSRYYIFTKHLKDKGTAVHRLTAPLRNGLLLLQKITGFRRRADWEFRKGSQWVSITHAFCQYLLNRKSEILARFAHTLCPDEIFVQTVLWNSDFRNNIACADDDMIRAAARAIDWQRGSPYVWQEADAAYLAECSAIFARKFSKKFIYTRNDEYDKR